MTDYDSAVDTLRHSTCVNAEEAEAAYNRLCRSHPIGLRTEDCPLCAPFSLQLDRLAAECETRGCTVHGGD